MRGWITVKHPTPCDVCREPSQLRYSVEFRPAGDVFDLKILTIRRCPDHAPRVSGVGDCQHTDNCREARRRTA